MPSVPMYNRPNVAPTPRRAINVPVASEGAALAASALGTAAEAFEKERVRAGRIRADAAEAEIRGIGARLGDEVSRLQRTDAFGAEAKVAERWSSETATVIAKITDPEIRAMVEARSNILGQELRSRARTHSLNQTEVVRKESYTENQKGDFAMLVTASEEEVPGIMERISIRATENARLEGRTPEAIEREVEQVRATGYLVRVNGFVSNKQMDDALALLNRDDVRTAMSGVIGDDGRTMYDKARKMVESESVELRSQSIRDEAVSKFGQDEAAALTWVRETYKGSDEQAGLQAVRVHYAEQERLKKETMAQYSDEAMNAAYAGRPIPQATRQWLEQNEGYKVLAAAREVRIQTARGNPVQTNLVAFQELVTLTLPENRAKFLATNLLTYADRISREQLTQFMVAQAALAGGTRTPSQGISTAAVTTETFAAAQKAMLFDPRVRNLGDLETRPEDRNIFDSVIPMVDAALAAERETTKGEVPPARAREIIRGVMDNVMIEQSGIFIKERSVVPITEQGRRDREIERNIRAVGAEVTPSKVQAIRLLFDRTDLTPAQKATMADRIARGQ